MERIPNGKYTKEFREEAVKLVTEGGLSIPEVGRRLSMPPTSISNWVKAYNNGKLSDVGKKHRVLSEGEMEIARLKRELAEVKMERDILKKAGSVLCEGVAARCAMIQKLRLQYPMLFILLVLKVSASGYYAWLNRKPSIRAKDEARLELEICAAHKRTRGTCGPERLKKNLSEHGVKVGVCRIRRIRKKLGIKCKQKRRFKATTDSKHKLPVADNLLNQRFEAAALNQVWLSDITYIPTDEGWLYLAGHKDICSGKIVGYAMSDRMKKELVSRSLFKAVSSRRPDKGLIHHSDRGSQYCSHEYRRLLDQLGMVASMSRKGNCYDNAPMESFWGTLKNELVYHCHYRSRQEAINDITEYIEIFYNHQRTQARLGYLSPAAYEKQLCKNKVAA
ncbi:MAG: IS3 family transposase [Nitrospirae bacterium]|nr:IS3 family transposase [Nitrospirota bacterium]